jgi:hypothetical protein
MSSTEAIKLEDGNGSVLMVHRVEGLAYAISVGGVADENGNPMPFRILDEDLRRRLLKFLSEPLG